MPKTNSTIRIDLHGMYVEDAMELLREQLARASGVCDGPFKSILQRTENAIPTHVTANG